MKRMRWFVALFAVWLVGLFSAERLDIDHLINMAWFVYVIAIVSVVVLLLIPLRRPQFYMLLFWMLATYVVCKAIHYRPIFWGIGKYITVSEIAVLLVTALFAWRIGSMLHQFEEAVEAISLPQGRTPLLPFPEVQDRLTVEMGRARRLQIPLSVVTIDLDPTTFEFGLHKIVREVQAAMLRRYVQVRVGLLLTRYVRETDIVARHVADGRFVVVAPATSADQAVEMLKRLHHQVETQTGIRFRYGIADFPAAGLTPEQLLHLSVENITSLASNSQNTVPNEQPFINSYAALPPRSQEHVVHTDNGEASSANGSSLIS